MHIQLFQQAITNYREKHGFEALSPKAVLFDMDGVLYDSMPNHAVAWQQSMAEFGISMTEADAYATEGARGIDTIRQMVLQQQGRDISLDEAQRMYDEKTRIFHELPETPVMAGIPALLQRIKDEGLTVGVVTGSGQRPLIDRLLSDFGQYLDERHIVTAYDVSRGKPAPDPYLMGMQKAATLPQETIVVENAPLGVRAAVAAGALTVAVNTGPLPDTVLLEAGADLLFSDMPTLSRRWPALIRSARKPPMTQDMKWEQHYTHIMQFMDEHRRRPSKHRTEDHNMLNWIKYNKKRMARNELPPERQALFCLLLDKARHYQRLNQFAYVSPASNSVATADDSDAPAAGD